MPTTVALFGAAGKMGTRISEKLRHDPEVQMLYVEAAPAAEERLRQRGLVPTTKKQAIQQAEIMILAIPDVAIGKVARDLVPALRSGAMVVALDPAAPHSGELPERNDITYFVCHPCHPPIVNDEVTPEARADFFGGVAGQHIVCSLMQGPEEDYARGEWLCRKMFAPVLKAHRVTVEQMAILEPALSETVVLTCMVIMREALDEAVAHGVPAEAARDFVLGHMRVNLGILFNFIDAQVSDGAKMAVQRARVHLFQPDWKKVFEPQNVLNEVRAITQGITAGRKTP